MFIAIQHAIHAFAVMALLLAAVGTSGVLSDMVAERRREIGIRMALGAGRSGVLAQVIKQGLLLTAVGIAAGVAGAFGLNRLIASLLFGVAQCGTDRRHNAGHRKRDNHAQNHRRNRGEAHMSPIILVYRPPHECSRTRSASEHSAHGGTMVNRPASARRIIVLAAVSVFPAAAMLSMHGVSHAQQAAAAVEGTANYTGETSRMDTDDMLVGRRRFAAGARSAWHIHPAGQLILVEEGRGRVQRRGQEIRELGAGASDFTGPGIPHWHGAAPDEHSVQATISFGGIGPWLEPVTDEEYAAPARR